ncbi:DUF5713 family protein [Rufibacter roseus]|uniref:DUF5713 family protein n=1 Tax=Rufibacter roseus TaxID=1567108 RepID=A0ABW2DNJ0_9BACT|nr:DUF5713 family protein [Rufibacter roseus]
MKTWAALFLSLFLVACSFTHDKSNVNTTVSPATLNNEEVKKHTFLKEMYADTYFPKPLVDKSKAILLELCSQIESQKPEHLEQLYKLTHAATIKFNDLEDEFFENGSEIETVARESIAADFEFISRSYGFEADTEELIAPRNW